MKKIIFLFAAAAVAFLTVSCNKNESVPAIRGVGAYHYDGNYIVSLDGTKFTLPAGSAATQRPELDRYYVVFEGAIPEGALFGPGTTVPITSLYAFNSFPTTHPIAKDEATYDDPIARMTRFEGGISIETRLNFLLVCPEIFLFVKNAKDNNSYAIVDLDIEVDDLIVPGPQNDTINMQLKIFNNRAEDENPVYNPQTGGYTAAETIAFDLEDLYFDKTDDAGKNKTYIIKLTYKSFEWDETSGTDFDELPVYTKFVTCEWTPGDPYGQDKN